MGMTSVIWWFLSPLVVHHWHYAYVTAIQSTLVKTSAGIVNGFSMPIFGTENYAFLGIPYAEPPVGEFRFQKPRPVQPWTGVRNASSFSSPCIQSNSNPSVLFNPFGNFSDLTIDSEDCLYLNVWTPKGSVGKDVIVWIHGGGFVFGASTVGDGTILSAFTDVVVVSMNYRLGMLGFSCFGTDDVNGNMGFFDQVEALKWVQVNIAAFGGNPNAVTIVGSSTGSIATTALVISPITRGLFKNAACMSGVITASWGTYTRKSALTITRSAASALGCREDTDENSSLNISSSVLRCLRNLPANSFRTYGYKGRYWGPTIDGVLLPDHPLNLLRSGLVNFTGNLLIGDTTQEGAIFLLALYPEYFHLVEPTYITHSQFADVISDNFQNDSQTSREKIQSMYTDLERPDDGFRNTHLAVDMIGDLHFVCPAKSFASALIDVGASVFHYSFAHRNIINPLPSWTGVTHGGDVDYWLGIHGSTLEEVPGSEMDLSRRVMVNLANFARSGDPSTQNFIWRPFTNTTDRYVVLDIGNYTTQVGLRSQQCAFWNFEAPSLGIGSGELIIFREF